MCPLQVRVSNYSCSSLTNSIAGMIVGWNDGPQTWIRGDQRILDGGFRDRESFADDAMQEAELGGDERRGVPVACPAGYVYAVEGLVEEVAEVGEGWEGKWISGFKREVQWWEGFEAEMERLVMLTFS